MSQKDRYIEHPVDGRPITPPPVSWGGIVFSLLAILSFGYWFRSQQDLKSKGILSNAKIVGWNLDAKSGIWINYQFMMNNRMYSGSRKNYTLTKLQAENMINRLFPVIFISNDPDNNELLVDSNDFKKYGVTLPNAVTIYLTGSLKNASTAKNIISTANRQILLQVDDKIIAKAITDKNGKFSVDFLEDPTAKSYDFYYINSKDTILLKSISNFENETPDITFIIPVEIH